MPLLAHVGLMHSSEISHPCFAVLVRHGEVEGRKHNLFSQKQGLDVFWRLCPSGCRRHRGTCSDIMGKEAMKPTVKSLLGWWTDPQHSGLLVTLISSAPLVRPAPPNYWGLAGGLSLPQPDPCESGRVLQTASWRIARSCYAFIGWRHMGMLWEGDPLTLRQAQLLQPHWGLSLQPWLQPSCKSRLGHCSSLWHHYSSQIPLTIL